MACKYFVNGDWVTENQLKELLQGGLLDTLISDGTLAIKGFKVDPDKVIKTDTVITKRQSIPANKLANILAQEIKTRQGYSPNMLSALELKEDGSDFKIPLWASPYASKFESLLTSLVSNKVVKQKFPGGSYVLGSEEGFRIKEGDAAAGELKNSGIVFTENFDPEKGLQPMRWDPETKKILPAQIMLPFKFRDEDGNILPLKDFMIEGEDGRMILDTSKLPAKLLNLFGFRIPTQERNSMAAVEIVGFLPETSGDLLLAPRDFTKQMGSDFDVDKLYTYMYNYFYKDGKLQTGFMSDKKKIAASLKIQKEHLADIKNELKLNKADRKLIDDYIKERIEFNENGDEVVSETANKASELISEILSKESNKELGKALDATFNTISILNRSYKAVRQNNILDIHLQIMTSTNPEIIASIIALDSFGEFEQLAIDIDNARNGNKKMPNILSETYQRTKFINATAGKNGVGSFSLDSTFNSTAQGKEIVIQNLTEEAREQLFGTVLNPKPRPTSEEVLAANTPLATFGNVISRGDVSNKYTLRSQEIIKKAKLEKRELTPEETQSLKYKSSIIRALQSTAVDNEKAQILDKLNINDETFDVIRALSILGFEEQEIVGLITQEIIWEYVEKVRNSNSSLTPYNPNAAEDIFAELALKYDPSGTFAALDESRVELLSSKSAEDLMDNIKNKRLMRLQSGTTPDFNLEQLALLRKFQNLTATGKTIKVLQSTINTESSGIPKSLLETQGKIEQIERLPFLNVFNAEKLLGKYEEGKLSTPTTINGYAALYGAVFANEIFDKYFPYKSNGFELAVEEIVSHMPRRAELSTTKKAELQSEIFDAVKSYLYANSNTNLFGENPDVERRRLFIDSKQTATKPKNDSLATILQTLSEGANSKSWYQKNGFLNKLSFNLNKNGTISRINFEAAAGENFDETNIYDGFSYLLSKNFAVGNFNGIDYTSRMLAQELVAAAFLEGGTQGAKQYLKYVPVAYLKSLGFGEYLQGVPFDFQATFFGTLGENGLIYNRPSNFTRQYFQNNPEVTKTVRLSDLKGNIVATPEGHFTLNEAALSSNFVDSTNPVTGDATKEQTQFLSIYDSKLPTKYALYEFDSVERIYRRIPVLNGSFDFVSYNSESKNSLPIEAKEIITTPVPQQTAPGYSIPNIPVQPSKEFNVDVVNNTALPRTTADLPIDRNLANSKEALDDLLNILETADEVSTLNRQLLQLIRGLELPENFKVTYNKTEGRGSYDSAKDKETLNINLSHTKNQAINDLATVTAHELIHALTASSIRAYQDGNIEGLSARTIAAIQQLENLQKLYIDQLVAKEGEEGLKKFKELYFNWKQGKTSIPSISKEDISKYYGAIKLTEFVTMALTDVGFQEHLNSITDESGISLWEQLKELIANLLNTLGLDIKPGSALASAVKDTMDLIQANQETIRENNIETRQFLELGTTYRFQVDGNGKVIKAEYVQGGGMFKSMNAKTQQAKYDDLKNKPNTQGGPTTQPSTGVSQFELEALGYGFYKGDDGTYDLNHPEDGIIAERVSLEEAIEVATLNAEREEELKSIQPATNRKTYSGKVTKLAPNQIFVFGSNPEGRHGAGAAKYARDNFGAIYGQGEGLQGQSYGLPTKDLRVKTNNSLKSISPEQIISSIKKLYNLANSSYKEFLVSDYSGTNLNGYTGQEMADMFIAAGPIPDNIIFHENFDKLITTQPSTSVEPVVNKKYEIFPGVFANAGQTTAIDKLKEFLDSDEKAFLLEGKGGTGKTTIIKQILAQVGDKRILAIAPSHKAKKVLAKSLKGIDADIKTLASALAIKLDESTGKFEPDEYARKKGNVPIGNGQIIVIDESSMVSDALLSEIKQWVSAGAKVIFMGDRAQLPPVGQEKDSDVFGLKNSYTLTEKMRQAATSPIIGIGTKIAANAENNTSRVANPITPADRVNMFDAVSGSTITWESNENNALNEFVEDLQKAEGDVNFAKIVTFNNQNHNSPQSVKNLNAKVRFKLFGERARTDKFIPGEILTAYDSYNPTQGKEEADVVFFNSDDMIIESVRFIANHGVSVEVFSGAKGRRSKSYNFDVEMLTLQNDDGKTITKNGRNVEIPVVAESSKEEYAATLKQLWAADRQLAYALQAKFGNLEYGYAITSHKAQGSTYTNVYVMEDNIMGSSNAGSNKAKSQSLYVAVSRPTTKLVMVSSKNNQDVSTKSTGLDLSKLSGSITDYQSMPTSNYGEESDRMSNRPSDDDWEAYNRAMNTNELLPDSTINSEEFRNYLLICGK
jgi:exodeoxyribonuclease-5